MTYSTQSPKPVKFYLLMFLVALMGIWFISTDVISLLPLIELSPQSVWITVQHGFGEALIIAAALGLTVDSYVKRSFAKEVAIDVSSYMAANQLPFGIQDELASLSNQQVYRDDFRIEWQIDHLPGDDIVTLTSTVRYRLTNVLDDSFSFEHYVATGKALIGADEQRRITYAEGPGYVDTPDIDGGTLGAVDGDYLAFRKSVDVPGKSSASFCATVQEMAPTDDSDSVNLNHAAVNISVQVISPPQIVARVNVAHRKAKDFRASGDGNNKTWKFSSRDTAMMPTQSIHLQWRLVENDDTEQDGEGTNPEKG